MKRLISLALTVFCCICVVVATERRALAYVDPGSGLLALQSAGAVLATFGYFMRRRVMALFGKKTAPLPVVVKTDSRKPA